MRVQFYTDLHVVCVGVLELCEQLVPTRGRRRLYTGGECPGRAVTWPAADRLAQSGVVGVGRLPLPYYYMGRDLASPTVRRAASGRRRLFSADSRRLGNIRDVGELAFRRLWSRSFPVSRILATHGSGLRPTLTNDRTPHRCPESTTSLRSGSNAANLHVYHVLLFLACSLIATMMNE